MDEDEPKGEPAWFLIAVHSTKLGVGARVSFQHGFARILDIFWAEEMPAYRVGVTKQSPSEST